MKNKTLCKKIANHRPWIVSSTMQDVGEVPTCAVLPIPLHKDVGDVEMTPLQNILVHNLQYKYSASLSNCETQEKGRPKG